MKLISAYPLPWGRGSLKLVTSMQELFFQMLASLTMQSLIAIEFIWSIIIDSSSYRW
jgi:hypothetical protein